MHSGTLINSLKHIKWDGQLSEEFDNHQGVMQGGVLSMDFYKASGNSIRDRLGSHNR